MAPAHGPVLVSALQLQEGRGPSSPPGEAVIDDSSALDRGRRAHERALLARVREGDEAAFEALYRAYYRPLLRFAFPLTGSAAAAEEVVADVFVHLWERRTTLQVQHAVNTYLFTATRNRALNLLRHERVERRWRERMGGVDEEESIDAPAIPTPDAAIDEERIRDAVQRAIATLPEQRRLVVTLRWEQGMSYAEIAEVVGSSVVAVERQLSRALKALRVALPEWLSAEDLPSA